MTQTLEFNEAEHAYTLDGRPIPSVTTILDDVGLRSHWARDDHAMARGTAVHKACHYWLSGGVDPDSIDPRIANYLLAFQQWWADVKPTLIASEERCFDPVRWYAGTLDLRVLVATGEALIDIKTGTPQPADAWQTAGYAHAVYKSGARYILRQGLYLRADGTYNIKHYTDHGDLDVFFSAVNIFHAKRKVGNE